MPADHSDEAIGAIFPILPEHVSRLFSALGCNVFVKFTKMSSLKSESKLVFYVSRKGILIGEATVRKVEKLSPEVAWSRYKDRIYLKKRDFDSYVSFSTISRQPRKMNEITVLILDQIVEFKKPISPEYPIPPSGRSLTRKLYSKICTRKS